MREDMGTMKILMCLLAAAAHATALVTSPPSIVRQPTAPERPFVVAQSGEPNKPVFIECEAVGEPAPHYRWEKNGKPFDYTYYSNRITQQRGRGSLIIVNPKNEDEGQYQCFADNEWGTAASNTVFLRKAELNSFEEADGESKILTAEEGRPFKLPCNPPYGWPKPRVDWKLQDLQGGLKAIYNPRLTVDPEGNLWFSNVTRFDASDDNMMAYTCIVESSFRNEYKLGSKVFLKVTLPGERSSSQNKYPPEQQYTTRKNKVVLRGETAELYCIYGGTPLPQVVWRKNGEVIQPRSRVRPAASGMVFVLEHVREEDSGTYTCEVSNKVGSAQTHSINLVIKAAPSFTLAPQSQILAEHETAVIRCKAEGSPEPEIKWVYNGQPIERAPAHLRRTVSADSITITDLTKQDTGNYGCNATNPFGYVYKDVYINVQAIPPEIKWGPEKLTKTEGSVAVLRCHVIGAPRPVVMWMRDDVELTGEKYNVTSEGDLVIYSVTFADAGQYRCYAQNKFGERSAYGSIDVKKRTEIVKKPLDVDVVAGQQASFRCTPSYASGYPFNLRWEFKGVPIDYDRQPRFRKATDYSLHISGVTVEDAGQYACVARTILDQTSVRAQATLTVRAA